MLEKLDGLKTYLLAGFIVALGLLKLVTDIPEVETITVLGISEASTLISTGIGLFVGRSTLKKFET